MSLLKKNFIKKPFIKNTVLASVLSITALLCVPAKAEDTILNASYDVSRELFEAVNPLFQKQWKSKTGKDITINQSHAGSSKQAQSILQGLKADVVTFNQITDVKVLHDKGNLIAADWQKRLPNASSPFYSTTAFLVRKGNPKHIKNWDDLARADVKLVFPNPKTSGNGRYTYLAAWLFADQKFNHDNAKTREFVQTFLRNVAVFDTGGRAATVTFAEREIGDVLLSFESEVKSISKEYGADKFDVVVPPVSVLAEFPVAVVDNVVDERGTREVATEYLKFLYTPAAQDAIAALNYRVYDPAVAKKYAAQLPELKLLNIENLLGPWEKIQKTHFDNNAIFDQLVARP
jgi:sulfate transport system substrate-binding protein